MEARDSFCFPKKTKNPNPSPIGKKFGFCCCGAPSGTRTLGPLIKRASRRFVSIYGSFESSLFFNQSNVIFHPAISASFVGFCSEKHLLHVLKPCRNRALTLRQMINRPIPHRLDGIGLNDRTSKSNPMKFYFLHGSLQQNSSSVFPCRLHGKPHCITARHWIHDSNRQMFWAAE